MLVRKRCMGYSGVAKLPFAYQHFGIPDHVVEMLCLSTLTMGKFQAVLYRDAVKYFDLEQENVSVKLIQIVQR